MSDDSSNRTDVSTIHLDNISLQNRDTVDECSAKFLGFDLSTQQLKAIVIDDKLKVCHNVSIDFDLELAEYKTRGGVHRADHCPDSVTAPVNMWLKALDMCMDKLKVDGLDFSSVVAISGCAQQHGSVWWRRESAQLLAQLNPDEYLHKELLSAFTLRDTPIWMDSSTSAECRQLERLVGGPMRMAAITGSRAYERFTGAQIAKVLRRRREVYLVTERITLVSNFLSSLLCGAYAPFDAADASGMNMMELRSKRWSNECLRAVVSTAAAAAAATAEAPAVTNSSGGSSAANANSTTANAPPAADPLEAEQLQKELAGLRQRLGCAPERRLKQEEEENIVSSHELVGRVSRYFVERYGFPAECLVASFTGDNPASLAGLCVGRDELVISLGTSDTAFFWLDQPRPNLNGHVLRNPLDDTNFMGLICFKNGSRTRERIRDLHARGSWAEFERLLGAAPPGNLGHLAFLYDLREIFPLVSGDFRYDPGERPVPAFGAPELEVRACVEGQFMRLRHHSQLLGLDMGRIRRLLVTGGASANAALLQVAADVFGKPVYVLDSVSNSACLGGAYLAKYAYELEQQRLDQSFRQPAAPSDAQMGREQAAQLALEAAELALRPIDFSEMVLGNPAGAHDDEQREIRLVRAAEPALVAPANVYGPLLERYVRHEAEIASQHAAQPGAS